MLVVSPPVEARLLDRWLIERGWGGGEFHGMRAFLPDGDPGFLEDYPWNWWMD